MDIVAQVFDIITLKVLTTAAPIKPYCGMKMKFKTMFNAQLTTAIFLNAF